MWAYSKHDLQQHLNKYTHPEDPCSWAYCNMINDHQQHIYILGESWLFAFELSKALKYYRIAICNTETVQVPYTENVSQILFLKLNNVPDLSTEWITMITFIYALKLFSANWYPSNWFNRIRKVTPYDMQYTQRKVWISSLSPNTRTRPCQTTLHCYSSAW